jgi:hypothetical protein
MQMWDYMTRLMLDPKLLAEMSLYGNNDREVFERANRRDRFHMSRAEISDIAGLLGQEVFVRHAGQLGESLRMALQTAGISEWDVLSGNEFAELRAVVGLLCIDEPLLRRISEMGVGDQVRQTMEEFHFRLEPKHAEVLRQIFGKRGSAIAHAHAIHLCWSPPECFSAVTFTDRFERPEKGGVRRTKVVEPPGNHSNGPAQAV